VPAPGAAVDVRAALWGARRLDLLGQLIVIFVGDFGVVILFKEERKKASLEQAREQIRAITGAAPVVEAQQGETEKEAA